MSDEKVEGCSCIPKFAWTLFFIFLILKLCDVIDWSWWWVSSPIWIWFSFWTIITLAISAFVVARIKLRD